METFHWIVIAIAIVLLILSLTAMAIYMNIKTEVDTYPMLNSDKWNPCPDKWQYINNRCYATKLMGSTQTDSKNYNLDDLEEKQTTSGYTITGKFFNKDGNIVKDSGVAFENKDIWVEFGDASICDKKDWANSYRIRWDGVTNYSDCS